MKTITLFWAGIVLFSSSLVSIQGQVEKGISLGEVLEQIEKNHAINVVGIEYVDGDWDKMADAAPVLTAVRKMDLLKLRKIIDDETDYECLTGKDYVVIIPKDDPSRHDLALSKRTVTFPNAMHVPVYDFLAQIKSLDESKQPVYLDGPIFFESQAGGSISIERGQGICYQLLNALTRKLKARSWRIEHIDLDDPKTRKPILPMKLGEGNVSFFARPSLSWITAMPPYSRDGAPATSPVPAVGSRPR